MATNAVGIVGKMLYLIPRWISRSLSRISRLEGEISRDPSHPLLESPCLCEISVQYRRSPCGLPRQECPKWFVLPLICLTKPSWASVSKSLPVPLPFASFVPTRSLEMLGFTREALSSPCPPNRANHRIKFLATTKRWTSTFCVPPELHYIAMIDAIAAAQSSQNPRTENLARQADKSGVTCRWRTFSNCSLVD